MFGALHTIAVSLLLLSSQALALSYYISSSCNSFPAMNRALAEAFTMAKVSSQRLANQPPDPDIENAFRRIFNTPTANNQARSEVFRIMSGIVGMTPERVRERANVRIYCDEDSRWQLQEDREPIPSILYEAGDETRLYQNGHLIPNSRRGPDDQVWVDRANGMLYRGEIGCDHKAAEMYPEANRAYDGVQIRDRVTFTFCSPFTEQGTPTVADLIDQGVDLGTQILGYPPLDGLLSLTVMHELTHIPAFDSECRTEQYWAVGWTNYW